MAKIYVVRKIPQAGLDLLKDYDVVVGPEGLPSHEEVVMGARGAVAILSTLTDKINSEIMDSAGTQLKVIANMATGFDNIDVAEATKRQITVTNTPGVTAQAVAEHTWALILAIAKRVVESDKFMRAGKYEAWGPELFLGLELKRKTLGILGMGQIGYQVAHIGAAGFGMNVIYNDIKPSLPADKDLGAKMVDLSTLFIDSDIVSIHMNLTPKNRHLVDSDVLSLMKPAAYLINTSRGLIIDEEALVEALKNKAMAGAALDVFENEPKMELGLSELDNVVVTPHIASATSETRNALAMLAAQSIIDVLNGKAVQNTVRAK